MTSTVSTLTQLVDISCTAKNLEADTAVKFEQSNVVISVSGSMEGENDVAKTDATVNIKKVPLYTANHFTGKWFLLTYKGEVAEGQVPTYNGTNMQLLNGNYVAMVTSDALSDVTEDDFNLAAGTATKVVANPDLNRSGDVNIVDAQIAFDLTNGVYNTLEKRPTDAAIIGGDVNADDVLNSLDARAIQVYAIYGSYEVA